MPTIKANDINMYYEIEGQGEPLVIISGLGGEISDFAEHRDPRITEKYRSVLFDNRGVGRTDKPDAPYSIEQMAEDTVRLMDALGIKRAHIMGASMGSRIALAIAAKYPERVNGLVLNLAGTRISPFMKLVTAVLLHIPGYKNSLPRTAKFLFDQKYPPTAASLARQIAANAQFDGRKLLHLVKAPTLIVNGTKDPMAPVKYCKELAAGITGSKLILIEGDHTFTVTNPDLLIKPMLEFLAEIDAKQAAKVSKPVS